MNCSNLRFNVEQKDGLFPVEFLQAFCISCSYFLSVLKIVHSSPDSDDKVNHISFFVLLTSLTKTESCSTY